MTDERPPWEDYAAPEPAKKPPKEKTFLEKMQAFGRVAEPYVMAPMGGTEALPAAGAMLGGGLTASPTGAAAGAVIGESSRQLINRALDKPAAPGLLQTLFGFKPDSLEASIAGLTGEGLLAYPAAVGGAGLHGISEFSKESGLRDLASTILHPRLQADKNDAVQLGQRMVDENMVPGIWGMVKELFNPKTSLLQIRGSLLDKAGNVLKESTRELKAAKNALFSQGASLPVDIVADRVQGAIPQKLVTGQTPRQGMSQRRAYTDAWEDLKATLGGRRDVPLELGMGEKERLDEMAKGFWDSKVEKERESLKPILNAANAWRQAIRDNFGPEDVVTTLAGKLKRNSELIDITNLLRMAKNEAKRVGSLNPAGKSLLQEGFLTKNIPGVRTVLNSPQYNLLSSAGKRLASALLQGGSDSIQAWMRIADQFRGQDERPSEKDLRELVEIVGKPGVRPADNLTTTSEEDFIRRYQ